MAKQPYLPFYIGDYVRDTRMLPLNVRGGWIEIFIASWDNNGEVEGTIEDFARLLSCSITEANQVIQIIRERKICDFEELPQGRFKIISRKIKKLIDLKKKRQNAGINGGNPNLKKNLLNQKVIQIPEDENGIGSRDLYLTPKDYLYSKISTDLTVLNMKSHLSKEDFDFCLTQWSLKAESEGWQYSGNDETDLKRLRAGFEKWLNSWVKNNAQKLLQKKNERSTSKHDDLRELRDSSIAVVQGNNAQ